MNTKSLEKAIQTAGGQTALARLLGVKQGHVWNWLHRNKKVPPVYALKIEKAIGISKHLLRPDIYPSE